MLAQITTLSESVFHSLLYLSLDYFRLSFLSKVLYYYFWICHYCSNVNYEIVYIKCFKLNDFSE